ncbi:MAG: hypothetical protein ABWZ52_13795 [Acidimicrobiales bacterium]
MALAFAHESDFLEQDEIMLHVTEPGVEGWDSLDPEVQALIEELEGRPWDSGTPLSVRLQAEAVTAAAAGAHDACDESQFCRNPLHPGPCKGWKKNLPGATPAGPAPAAKPAAPAKRAPKKAAPPATPPAPAAPAAPAKATKKTAKAAAPTAPTPAQAVAAGDFTGLKQVGPQGGSNPGGVFQAADGSRYYVKYASSEQWAREQAAAAELYRLAGVPTPAIIVGAGTPGLPAGFHTATEIVDGLTDGSAAKGGASKWRAKMKADFAVDAWLADWDIGQSGNAMAQADGTPMRMDIGGSLRFRARGGPKGAAFGATVGEWQTLRDKKNVSGPLFHDMTDDELIDSAAKVTAMTDADIKAVVKAHGLDAALANMLIKRRDDIKAKAAALEAKKNPQPTAPGTAVDYIAVDGGASIAASVASQIQSGNKPTALDIYLKAVADAQGFTGPPKLSTSVNIGKLGKAGTHDVIYRGVAASGPNPKSWLPTSNMAGQPAKTAQQIQDEFRTGDAVYGTGIYGNGYYFSTGSSTATSYSDRTAGSRVRAAIDLSSKVIDYQPLYNEWMAAVKTWPSGDPRHTVFHDPGAYAVARGYDAIRVPQGQRRQGMRQETYYVILNRTAVVVAK